MIRLADATTLALTKLRTRKVRLTITIVISGLLLSGLAAASFVARGVMNGINDFGKEGLGDRYIAQTYPQYGFGITDDEGLRERALAIQKDLVARKKAEAKRLGITYDPASEPSPVSEYDTPGGKTKSLNPDHPAARQAYRESVANQPKSDLATLKKVADPYKPINYYTSKQMSYTLDGARVQVLKGGKETYETTGQQFGPPTGTDSFVGAWSIMSSELLKPFLLPNQNLAIGTDGSIPIIVPNSAAEQILQLKSLPSSAKTPERLARTKEIREKAASITFGVCYRNSTSASLLDQAVSIQKEITQNKGKKNYQKPQLIYDLPSEPCGSAQITRDVRSSDDKKMADKQREFNELFGTPPAEQTILTFRIVGIAPDPDYSSAFGVGQIIRSLVSSTLGSGWYSPAEQLTDRPLIQKLFDTQASLYGGSVEAFYAEFATAAQARRFIEKENCAPDFSKFGNGPIPSSYNPCEGKFSINPYGSNSLALESAKRGFGKFFKIAALIVCGIACIIMMGTVGRTIADSRRETAVFRAIGGKRLDIAQIYIVYAIFLSLLICLFAALAGFALATIAHIKWSAEASLQAVVAYNAHDLDKTFSLYALYLPDLLLLAGFTIAAGLLSTAIPLIRNIRRNPIRDMRDDT